MTLEKTSATGSAVSEEKLVNNTKDEIAKAKTNWKVMAVEMTGQHLCSVRRRDMPSTAALTVIYTA